MHLDYIVVGSGLAGVLFCEQLRQHKKSFVMISDRSQQASIVSSGLYNPVVLKRFTLAWDAASQLELALSSYESLETLLRVKLDESIPVRRLFKSIEEQNNWFQACDQPQLEPFLSPFLVSNTNSIIEAPFGFGEVKSTGRIDTVLLLSEYQKFLSQSNSFIAERFDYNLLSIDSKTISYRSLSSKNLVFAEGYGLKKNPYFKYLPLQGTKGELLRINAPKLKLNYILKSSVFIIPLGADEYLVGSTYNWTDKTNTPTPKGATELIGKLEQIISCEFRVVEHHAGVRPTVIDRRPIVGQHPDFSNIYVLNGLGTRGVMIAPKVSRALFDFIVDNNPLPKEIDIKRFS